MRFAEHHCQCLWMGMVQFLPELTVWWQKKELWRLVMHCKSGHHIWAQMIQWLAHCLHIRDPLLKSFEEAWECYKWTAAKYEELKPKHKLLHQTFLSARLQDLTLSDKHHAAITKLVSTKWVWEAYWWIQSLKGLHNCTSISQVEITGPNRPQLISGCWEVKQTLCQSLHLHLPRPMGPPSYTLHYFRKWVFQAVDQH